MSLIIFCYNEAESIERVILSARELSTYMNGTCEIIVVDDGSTDDTQIIAEKHDFIRYIRHAHNKGIGTALRTGYGAATREYVCAVPGDGQFDLMELKNVQPFTFSRFYSFYRPSTGYGLYRQGLTRMNQLFNKYMLGIDLRDVNWIKVYRKEQLDFVDPELYSSIVESEICCKLIRSGSRPIELPSVYHQRTSGDAKGGKWNTLSKAIKEVSALYTVTRRFNKTYKQ